MAILVCGTPQRERAAVAPVGMEHCLGKAMPVLPPPNVPTILWLGGAVPEETQTPLFPSSHSLYIPAVGLSVHGGAHPRVLLDLNT